MGSKNKVLNYQFPIIVNSHLKNVLTEVVILKGSGEFPKKKDECLDVLVAFKCGRLASLPISVKIQVQNFL